MVHDEREEPKHWEEIAAQASTEHDGEKLTKLVEGLCKTFDQDNARLRPAA